MYILNSPKYNKNQTIINYNSFSNFKSNLYSLLNYLLNYLLKTRLYSFVFVFIFFSFFSINLFGQQFTTFVNPNPVQEGELFTVTFVLRAEGSNFNPPKFSNFTIISGPSTSSEYSFVNGRTSRQVKYTYTLKADKKGEYNIDPASVKIEDAVIKSNSVKVSVIEASQAVKERRNKEDEENKSLADQANKIISDNLYAKVFVNKSNAIVGEQLVATYKIYINEQLNLVDLSMSKAPSFIGFWTQSFDEKQLNYDREVINGSAFKVATVKKVVLLPQKSGKLIIDAMDFKSVVRLRTTGGGGGRRNNMFNDFFNDSYKDFPYTVTTQPYNLMVKELPTASSNFKGAVGEFKIEAWVDRTETTTNDPITLKVKISGVGNLKLISPLELKLPTGFESYEPKTIDNIDVNLNGMSGNVIFEYLLLPRNQGKFKIEPINFTYFNNKINDYTDLVSDEFIINVKKGKASDNNIINNSTNKEDAKYLGQDIRFIKLNSKLEDDDYFIFSTLLHYLMLLTPALFGIVFAYFYKKNILISNNSILLKNKRANKVALNRLKLANNYLKENKLELFFDETNKALWGYVSDKLSIPVSELNKDIISKKLVGLSIKDETIVMLITTINDCELARYSNLNSSKNPQDIYLFAETVITEIEGTLK